MAYLNSDGLYVKVGTEKATPTLAGEYCFFGPLHCIEVKINLATLVTGSAIINDVTQFPVGAFIEEIEVVAEVLGVGATATLNLGLIRTDRTTAYNAAGFLTALPLTSFDAAGEKTVVRVGSTGAGAFLGTSLANTGLLVADWDTAAMTAGTVKIRIYYYRP
jgi:hypothetical protein